MAAGHLSSLEDRMVAMGEKLKDPAAPTLVKVSDPVLLACFRVRRHGPVLLAKLVPRKLGGRPRMVHASSKLWVGDNYFAYYKSTEKLRAEAVKVSFAPARTANQTRRLYRIGCA